jgi:hypothetical protein
MVAHKRKKPPEKAKLTDSERHARFIETARKVEASEDPKDFERAFKSVTAKKAQRAR